MNKEIIYKLEVNANDLQVLNASLQEMPLKFALPVMQKLQAQIVEQSKPQEVKA